MSVEPRDLGPAVPAAHSDHDDQTPSPTELHPPRQSLLPLLAWLSPGFPIGSFAFSHGLEWTVSVGDVRDAATSEAWLAALLRHGAARNDAILLAAAWRATESGDRDQITEFNALAVALAGSRERHMETTAQGTAFLTAVRSSWPAPALDDLAQRETEVAYPIAVAVAASAHSVPLLPTLEAFALAGVQSLVSAIIRLGALGQTDGQKVIARLVPAVTTLAQMAAASTIDELGGAAFRSDIASIRHETLTTRLFRT